MTKGLAFYPHNSSMPAVNYALYVSSSLGVGVGEIFCSRTMVPIVEDYILKGRLRRLEVIVENDKHSRRKDRRGCENWEVMRRICNNSPVLWL
jgi:hypothetical protein